VRQTVSIRLNVFDSVVRMDDQHHSFGFICLKLPKQASTGNSRLHENMNEGLHLRVSGDGDRCDDRKSSFGDANFVGYVLDNTLEQSLDECSAGDEEAIQHQPVNSGKADEHCTEFWSADETNVDKFMDDFILDSIAVQFHAAVFWQQFLPHIIFPLSYFLLNYKVQGFAVSYDFLWQPSFYFNIFFPSVIYVMAVLYYLCPVQDELPVRGALWVPIIFFIQHRMTVALKYASLSPSEYAKFQSLRGEGSGTAAERYMQQMQLLTGWATRDKRLLQFELGCAAARIGAKINEISIVIADPSSSETARKEFACWNALLHGQATVKLNQRPSPALVRHADGSYTLSVYDLSKAIVLKADANSGQGYKWVIYIFVVLMIMIPWVTLSNTPQGLSGRSSYLYAFLVCNCIAFWMYGLVDFLLLYVSVWDVSRQLHMVRYLHRLIRITDLTLDTSLALRHRGASKSGPQDTSFTLSSRKSSRSKLGLGNRRNSSAKDSVRLRELEHLREKMSVILSVTKSEKRKSVSVRRSVTTSGGLYRQQSDSRKSDRAQPTVQDVSRSKSRSPPGPDLYHEVDSSGEGVDEVSPREHMSRFYDYGAKHLQDEDQSHIPQLSFRQPENIIGWTYARLVFQHFGERFRTRIDTYTGALNCAVCVRSLCCAGAFPYTLACFCAVASISALCRRKLYRCL
jgi:hypothetical protein